MDEKQLRKVRIGIRRMVTNTSKQLEEMLVVDSLDVAAVKVKIDMLQEYNQKLRNMDEQILEKMTVCDGDGADTEEELDKELDQVNTYQEKVKLMVFIALDNLQVKEPRGRASPPGSDYSTSFGDGEKKKQYQLPKIQLKKFNGQLSEWLGWWSQFSKIHEDEALHNVDKFVYLSQCMVHGTRAKELVDSYPMTGDNYGEVIQALKDRFGQEDLLIPHYIRGLLKIVILNATKKEKVVLSSLYDKVETDIRALGTLKVTTQEMGRFLHPIVESCLSEEVFVAWQRSPWYDKNGAAERPPRSKLDYLLQFLKEEAQREMKREQAKEDFNWETVPSKRHEVKPKKPYKSYSEEQPTNAGLYSQNSSEKSGCIFCGKGNHQSSSCYKGKAMTLDDKRIKIKEKNACFSCLIPGHRANQCRGSIRCSKCSRRHPEIMCPEVSEQEPQNVTSDTNTVSGNLGVQCQNNILLKTMVVKVKIPNSNKEKIIRVLLDDGSQRSYITKRTVLDISSKPIGREKSRIVLMDGSVTDYENINKHEVVLSNLHSSNNRIKLVVREKLQIGCQTPKISCKPWMKYLKDKNIFISDLNESYSNSLDIDILIGSDYYEKLRTGRRVQVQNDLYAVETLFGWTLSGPLPGQDSCSDIVTQSYLCGELSKLWDLDVLGIRDTADKEEKAEKDTRVKDEFQGQISRVSEGRYSVKLPWIKGAPFIPNNKAVAQRRLESATSKLVSQGHYDKYDNIFKEWESEQIIEEVVEDFETRGHYLPHRPVFKPDSLTTPVRPVFDASCRVGKNPSLNMCVETGPNLLELIPSILLRFRRYPVGALADIRKAFQMIGVSEEDRDYQKFLWWKDYDHKVMKIYRHCRVVFGMTCSPFILAAVIDHHLGNVTEEKSSTVDCLRRALYVDNVVASFKSKEDYSQFKEESTSMLADAQMCLRQWESNTDSNKESVETTALGLVWNKEQDTLYCKLPKSMNDSEENVTSRSVLSTVSQIFDPIGFVCPALLLPKVMLQKAWLKSKRWDDSWEEEDAIEFRDWKRELPQLQKIGISRFAFRPFVDEDLKSIQIHVFCDASNAGYASVVFARVEVGNRVEIQFLLARSRVSPLEKKRNTKKVTIPRLELLACVIGARLKSTVCSALDFQDMSTVLWSDSTTSLAWINRDEDWGTYVGNRVREINRLTRKEDWKHVPGKMNPADFPSRGGGFSELLRTKWWEGPEWLKVHKEWPSLPKEIDEAEVDHEKKKTTISAHALERKEPRFSHYLKNVKVLSWVRRFINNCKTSKLQRNLDKRLSVAEVREGERDLLVTVQKKHFLEKPNIKGFAVIQLSDGLWHLQTRLTYREDKEDFKFPIILPKEEPIVEQLVRYVHQSSYHSGTQHVLGRLRERYWVVHGRNLVKRIIHNCVKCQRYRIGKMNCNAAPLPDKRIEATAVFENTGVDLAGPLMVKEGKKAWIVLYTCAVYRGVHLDVVDSLSSEAFLMSLERFVNTVGRPNTLYSDNGTNFVGSFNLMKKIEKMPDWKKWSEKFQSKRINWNFNPPSAPWWGGWWERLVRSVKEILRKMLGTARLTYDELRTCLAAVSQVINERPLCTVTADAGDLMPLTPAMFMRDLPMAEFHEGEIAGAKFLQGRYKKMQELKRALQARFRKEYLGFLTSRNCEDTSYIPRKGSLVLVGDSNKKRFEWPLGRIIELIPGKDRIVRVAKVKTNNGVVTRPLQRLHELEIPNLEEMREMVQPYEKLKTTVDERDREAPAKIDSVESSTVTTRGRVTKKPLRYGTWCY